MRPHFSGKSPVNGDFMGFSIYPHYRYAAHRGRIAEIGRWRANRANYLQIGSFTHREMPATKRAYAPVDGFSVPDSTQLRILPMAGRLRFSLRRLSALFTRQESLGMTTGQADFFAEHRAGLGRCPGMPIHLLAAVPASFRIRGTSNRETAIC